MKHRHFNLKLLISNTRMPCSLFFLASSGLLYTSLVLSIPQSAIHTQSRPSTLCCRPREYVRPPDRDRKYDWNFRNWLKSVSPPILQSCMSSVLSPPACNLFDARKGCWNYSCNTGQHRRALLKRGRSKIPFPQEYCTLTSHDDSMLVGNKCLSTYCRCQNDMTNTQLTLRLLCSCGQKKPPQWIKCRITQSH